MATNPMQRRARNSFLGGMVVAILIAAIIVALLFMQLKNIKQELEDLQGLQKQVYVLAADVESGAEITSDMLIMQEVRTTIPDSAIVNPSSFMAETADGQASKVVLKSKVNLLAGTILTADMLMKSGEEVNKDTRTQEYNMIILPSDLVEQNYVDIRLRMPTGEDYIVISKKRILKATQDTITMNLSEDEILTMGNAIVEAYIIEGAKLYAAKYTEPGLQDKAIPTYTVSNNVRVLIQNSPNAIDEAKVALNNRYNSEYRNNLLEPALSNYTSDERNSKVSSGVNTENTKTQEAREAYLGELDGM